MSFGFVSDFEFGCGFAALGILIRASDAAHGGLPRGGFWPDAPAHAADSLANLLGAAARPLLLHLIAGPELRQLAMHYVCNEKLSGRRLARTRKLASAWIGSRKNPPGYSVGQPENVEVDEMPPPLSPLLGP